MTVTVTALGRPGHDYAERTEKAISIVIKEDEKIVLERRYRVEAAAVEWRTTWANEHRVDIGFFDFPDGMTIYDSTSVFNASQVISISFTYNASIGEFRETSFPADLVYRTKVPWDYDLAGFPDPEPESATPIRRRP